MSDPVACLALTVLPIFATWNNAADEEEQQNSHDDRSKNFLLLRDIFSCGREDIYEVWWNCVTNPCSPCAPEAFFHLDDDDDGVEDADHEGS